MRRAEAVAACVVVLVATSVCSRSPKPVVLTADLPLHLEDHLDAATFSESAATDPPTTNLTKPVEWRFDQPQPEWKASPMWNPGYRPAVLTSTTDSLKVTFTQQTRFPDGRPAAGIHLDVPDWDRANWAELVIRIRATPATAAFGMMLGFNVWRCASRRSTSGIRISSRNTRDSWKIHGSITRHWRSSSSRGRKQRSRRNNSRGCDRWGTSDKERWSHDVQGQVDRGHDRHAQPVACPHFATTGIVSIWRL